MITLSGLAQEGYPALKEFATDQANIFTSSELDHLKTKLTDFEQRNTFQMVVLTIDSLGFETIEQFAYGTFNKNGIGQADTDNGLLIVFAKSNRKVRIETGLGTEAYITDAIASRIIRNTMIPEFKEERYFEGLDKATDRLIFLLESPDALEELKQEMAAEDSKQQLIMMLVVGLFLFVFIAAGGFLFYKVYRNLIEIFRGMMIGKLGVLQGFFMVIISSFSIVFSLVFVLVPLGLFLGINQVVDPALQDEHFGLKTGYIVLVAISIYGFAILIAALKIVFKGKEDFKLSLSKNDKTYIRKTFSSSGSHSFGSGSSGGSSGGFSGGGGSSGGGGASGSW
ncbi:TPM domain-containing protein [Maribacter halichondriae]|uniref:TPM domain-containing protein n=1 Tax=Maribacter halichondriae TaxID=2980554 RepID=UPI002358FE94|nr:TPM domain-containing protein [Maribacter sp. Hal144]